MGATTIEEYRKYIEKDIALARRFQAIMVPEPTQEVAVAILKGTISQPATLLSTAGRTPLD